ncbi:hypothetical protein C3492_28895 [Streptomyces sp. Ru62]|nr:hypothetical protein C3492_28895 [Streptomyces sp. Ru62]
MVAEGLGGVAGRQVRFPVGGEVSGVIACRETAAGRLPAPAVGRPAGVRMRPGPSGRPEAGPLPRLRPE